MKNILIKKSKSNISIMKIVCIIIKPLNYETYMDYGIMEGWIDGNPDD